MMLSYRPGVSVRWGLSHGLLTCHAFGGCRDLSFGTSAAVAQPLSNSRVLALRCRSCTRKRVYCGAFAAATVGREVKRLGVLHLRF